MGVCECGKALRGSSTKCRRCAALQELGLGASASAGSIKSAYRLQVKEWHPDLHGKNQAQQSAAEEKTKRINIAYRFLTSPSKGKGVSAPPNSPASYEQKCTQSSFTSTESTNSKRTHSVEPRKREQPPKARTSRGVSHYPQSDFKKWEAAFKLLLINGTSASNGMKKWVRHAEARRASNIAFVENNCKRIGLDHPNLEDMAKPDDAKAYLMEQLWLQSTPNVEANMEERTRAMKEGAPLVEEMEKLAIFADEVAKKLQSCGAIMKTKSGYYDVSLDGVIQHCIQLSSLIRKTSYSIKEEALDPIKPGRSNNPYPLHIADCCMSLVIDMEDTCGLSQKECHALIACALRAHGCTPEEVTDFAEENIERGTIRAKKEAIRRRVLESLQVIFSNGVSPVPIPFKY